MLLEGWAGKVRYGLGVIFRLTRSLDFGLHSQATQLEGKVTTASRQTYGPITLYGQWPLLSWTLTCHPDREETLPNVTFHEAKMTCSYAIA